MSRRYIECCDQVHLWGVSAQGAGSHGGGPPEPDPQAARDAPQQQGPLHPLRQDAHHQ